MLWLRRMNFASSNTFLIVALVLPFLHIIFGLPSKTNEFKLDAAEIQHYKGYAYVAVVPNNKTVTWPWVVLTDSNSGPFQSTLRLLENGQQKGRPHTIHTSLFEVGEGNYSHWGGRLYFTASDNSDPRANKKTYNVKINSEI